MILLNPGPVNVTTRVRRALLGADICHREPEFSTLLLRISKKIQRFLKVEKTHQIAVFTGPGTAALESMLVSLADKKKKTLVLSNGVYGQRLRSILEAHELPFVFFETPITSFPALSDIETILKSDRSINAIAMVHHETSTGRLNPLMETARLAKKYGKLFFADVISSMGAEKIDFGLIDACAGTSGKCLHGFPGVAFVMLTKKAKQALDKNPGRLISLDLSNALIHTQRGETAFTPAVQIFYAFEAALDEALKEGLNKRIQNYELKAKEVEKGADKLGLRFLIEDASKRSHVLSTFWLPKGLSYKTLHDKLKKSGFVIYAGQSNLKDRIFRIAHLGTVSQTDLRLFFSELEKVLRRH